MKGAYQIGGMMNGRIALLIPVLLMLAGCAALTGYPAQPASLPTTVTSLDKVTQAKLIKEYNNPKTTLSRKKEVRNEIIYSDIAQIDQNFNAFKVNLNSQANTMSVGTDFISLALAGLGATVGNAAEKAALAAAAGGVIGAKAAIDKDVLYQKTVIALITEMEAQRSDVYARIIRNMNLSVDRYPLAASSKDLQDYYQAGTLVNALEGVSESASKKAQQATAAVAEALTASYSYNDLSKKLEKIWMPDGKTPNTTNAKKIQGCMASHHIIGSIPLLINAGTDEDKAAVLKCVNQ